MRAMGAACLAIMLFLGGCGFLQKPNFRRASTAAQAPAPTNHLRGSRASAPAAQPPPGQSSVRAVDPARATTPAPDPDPAPAQAAAAEEAHLGIPVDEIPPAGTCRVWLPGAPVESQSAAGSCAAVQKKVPAGAWVLHRSRDQSNVVAVNVYRSRWPVMVTETRYFDYWTGRLLRVE